MSIVEQGVGVGWKPLETLFLGVKAAAQQTAPKTSRPLFVNDDGWFLSASSTAKLLRFYIPPRLWTTNGNAADPGYTWGVHWLLAVKFSDAIIEPPVLAQSSLFTGSQLQLSAVNTPVNNPARPGAWYPTPGVPEFISCQGAAGLCLTMDLILASGLADQTVVCPLQLACGQSWSS